MVDGHLGRRGRDSSRPTSCSPARWHGTQSRLSGMASSMEFKTAFDHRVGVVLTPIKPLHLRAWVWPSRGRMTIATQARVGRDLPGIFTWAYDSVKPVFEQIANTCSGSPE